MPQIKYDGSSESPKTADIVDAFDKRIDKFMIDHKLAGGYCYRKLEIPNGYYKSMADVCEFLNRGFAIICHEFVNSVKCDYQYNENTNKISITGGRTRINVFIEDPNFEILTGIKLSQDKRFTGDEPMYAITNYFPVIGPASKLEIPASMYIYSDICDYQLVGDTQAPLLGILPISGDHKEQRYWSFVPPYYIGVTKAYVSEIELRLCTDTGDLVPFTKDSLVVARLHFRKKAPWAGI